MGGINYPVPISEEMAGILNNSDTIVTKCKHFRALYATTDHAAVMVGMELAAFC